MTLEGVSQNKGMYSMRILIAEDDDGSRQALEHLLTEWGHHVVACIDGIQAWQALQREDAPKLVILDRLMPGMDGVELCRRFRKLPHANRAYIVFLSAKEQTKDMVEGLGVGADDYMTKPFDREELRARINVGIRTIALQEQMVELERLQTLIQTAAAAAHEIYQPLTIILGKAELLQETLDADDPRRVDVQNICDAVERVRAIVNQMDDIKRYRTKPYLRGREMVDFRTSSGEQA